MKTEELPPGWALATGHELFAFVTSGSRGWADFYSDTGPVFVRIGNLDHHTISLDLRETQRVQPPPGAEGTRTRTRPDDILISITADVGMVGLVRPSLGEAYINQHIALARPVPGLNAAYLAWFLTSPRGKSQLRSMERGATKKGLGLDDIRAVKFPIAPLPEQERIVGELEKQFTRLAAGVEALKRVQSQLKRYRASVLKAACEGRLVPTEAELARREERDYEPADKLLARILKERRARWEADQLAKMKAAGKPPKDDQWKARYVEPSPPITSELSSLPEGWVWARAEQLCDFITKGTTPASDKLHAAGQVPFIKVYNLSPNGYLDFTVAPTFIDASVHTGELARSRVVPGDVLMNIVGPPLGKVAEVPNTYPEWNMNQAIAVFRPMPSLDRRFLVVCLRTESILSWAISRTKTTTGQVNLTLEICRDLPIPLAPLSEQQRIAGEVARHLSTIDFASSTIEANLSRISHLRQAVLKTAFEGLLVPQDPHDEPASKLLERISAAVENKPLPKPSRTKQTTAVPKMKATR